MILSQRKGYEIAFYILY